MVDLHLFPDVEQEGAALEDEHTLSLYEVRLIRVGNGSVNVSSTTRSGQSAADDTFDPS